MICEKCGMTIQEGRDYCINCGARINRPPDSMIGSQYGDQQPSKDYSMVDKKFSQTKTGVLLMAGGEILIGLFVSFYLFVQFAEIDPSFAAIVLLMSIAFLAGLPLLGLILIAAGANKPGGVVLIIGSVLCVPIGLVGVFGGINAMKLDT